LVKPFIRRIPIGLFFLQVLVKAKKIKLTASGEIDLEQGNVHHKNYVHLHIIFKKIWGGRDGGRGD
jgi:hypothetical protein